MIIEATMKTGNSTSIGSGVEVGVVVGSIVGVGVEVEDGVGVIMGVGEGTVYVNLCPIGVYTSFVAITFPF